MRCFWILFLGLACLVPAAAPSTADAGVVVRIGPRRPPPYRHPVRRVVRARAPGWAYVAAHPGVGGRWVAGAWVYAGQPPRPGYVYVSGYWRSGVWLGGFWRPASRQGYHWVEPYVAVDGSFVPGYWEPTSPGPDGTLWRPGYWNGHTWVSGAWVNPQTYTVYGENGEVEFLGYGDGEIQALALPATDEPQVVQGGIQVERFDSEPGEWVPPTEPDPSGYYTAPEATGGYPEYEVPEYSEDSGPIQPSTVPPPASPSEPTTWDLQDSELEGTTVRHHAAP